MPTAEPETWDVVVVGGGIVGLATARALLELRPGAGVLLVEKEPGPCRHQTGHNSGVIHTGLYYRPGSLKARMAVEGARRMRAFCEAEGVPSVRCGKLVVACDPHEVPRLERLHERGVQNGVEGLERIGPDRIGALQPGAAGLEALWVPAATITDFAAVGDRLAAAVLSAGGAVRYGTRCTGARRAGSAWDVRTTAGDFRARGLVTCAGLHSDRVARSAGARPATRIVPFRGEFLELSPAAAEGVTRLVYPTPDPALPFLGVHLTPRLDGRVEVGPNAVLALHREGYGRRFRAADVWEMATFRGTWRLLAQRWRAGLRETGRSLSRRAFARELRRMLPAVTHRDLRPSGCGIRAQAVAPSGDLLDDFDVLEDDGAVHVLNAPSPAATAALPIGEFLAERAARAILRAL